MRFGIWMLVGIFEKSRRWRMARIAMFVSRLLGFDIHSPGTWLEAPFCGGETAGRRLLSGKILRLFRCCRSSLRQPSSAYCEPQRSILRGENLFCFHRGSCYKRPWTFDPAYGV